MNERSLPLLPIHYFNCVKAFLEAPVTDCGATQFPLALTILLTISGIPLLRICSHTALKGLHGSGFLEI